MEHIHDPKMWDDMLSYRDIDCHMAQHPREFVAMYFVTDHWPCKMCRLARDCPVKRVE
jgi:hypothetical protein